MRSKYALALPFCLFAAACGGGGTTAETTATATAPADSTAKHDSTAKAAAGRKPRQGVVDTAAIAGNRPLLRETYGYEGSGRDPFRSSLAAANLGPELVDLRLVAVTFDSRTPGNSIATFRENGSDRRFVWRQGERAGRIYVVSITTTDVELRQDDFGVSHRQSYSLRKPEEEK